MIDHSWHNLFREGALKPYGKVVIQGRGGVAGGGRASVLYISPPAVKIL